MKKHLYIFTFVFLLSCQGKSDQLAETGTDTKSLIDSVVRITSPTLIVLQLDSLEIAKARQESPEDFDTASDDAIYYDAELQNRMDSLKTPVVRSQKARLTLQTPAFKLTVFKDTKQALFTYYYYDGKQTLRKEVFDLLGN